MNNYVISDAIENIIKLLDSANNYIDKTKPWQLAKEDDKKTILGSVLNLLVKVIEVVVHMFKPILYKSSSKALDQFGIDLARKIELENYNVNAGIKQNAKHNLFPRLDRE